MSNADKLGMSPITGWLVNLPFVAALLVAWLITPGLVQFISWRVEGRPAPLYRPAPFRSFIPGDYFLGVLFACSVVLSGRLPVEDGRWFHNSWWHGGLIVATIMGCMLARAYLDAPNYTPGQMVSPSKLYHDFVLYAGYGYVLVATALPAIFWTAWSGNLGWKLSALGAFAAWIGCLLYDQLVQDPRELAREAHIEIEWVR